MSFVSIVYNFLGIVLLPFVFLFAGVHALLKPDKFRIYLEKLSFVLPPIQNSSSEKVWIHAVSVGEVLSCEPLIRLLTAKNLSVRLSTGTQSGYDTAQKRYPYVEPFYFPFDFHFCVSRFLDRVKPHVILLCEMEIWPAFVWAAHRRHIPLYLISGRMVEKDFKRYRFFKWLFRPVLSLFTGLFMQNEIYLQRMGTICRHPRLKSLGSLKYDAAVPETPRSDIAQMMPKGFNLCAVSTHRGEEKLIISAFQSLLNLFPEIRLTVIPRNPHRSGELIRILERQRLSYTLRSSGKPCITSVFVVDTVGEASGVYQKCDLIIMGGSFSKKVGGHNIIEPALHGKCILCAHHMTNFEEIYRLFKKKAALVPTSRRDLRNHLAILIPDRETAAQIGKRASDLVLENSGVTRRIYHEIFQNTHGKNTRERYR